MTDACGPPCHEGGMSPVRSAVGAQHATQESPGLSERSAGLMGEGTSFMKRSGFVPMARIRNVFEIIELYGHDENFEPQCTSEFIPTAAPAGSKQKIDILAERIQRGMPLWHPEDSTDSSEVLVGAGAE
jgi:hypothetical protein